MGACGRGGAGAVTRCARSLIAVSRTERSSWGGGDWGSRRFAICEERSWSSSFSASFSSARAVSFWVTPESSCEMVTSTLTSWERRVSVAVSDGISPDRVCWQKSGMFLGFRRRELLAMASCSAMKAWGQSTASVDERVGRGEEAANSLPKVVLLGGSW